MANEEHIKWLRCGVKSWNERRRKHPFRPDFSGVYIPTKLQGSSYKEKERLLFSLKGIDLRYVDFCNASLFGLDLRDANLSRAKLREADLGLINLRGAELIGANFSKANLSRAKLDGVVADEARFTGANLMGASLLGAQLVHADFTRANLTDAKIKDVDLRQANLIGADITNTQPWKSVLYTKSTNMRPHTSDSSQKIESVGNLVKKCESFEKHYEDNSEGTSFGNGFRFYFRGERVGSWPLRPSVMRNLPKKGFVFCEREGEMLLELMSKRPEDFIGATSALSQLVVAQQHGLKTRLLDITQNPLVALFHACEHRSTRNNSNGILHVFVVPKCIVKSFDSDAISVVANFAKLPRFEQKRLLGNSVNNNESIQAQKMGYSYDYSRIMRRLYHHIRREKPHFKKLIDMRDLFRVFVVEPQQLFERIRVQSGAFLVSAFHERFEKDQILVHNKNTPVYDHYKLIVPATSKKKILDELRLLNIKREVLFPGLDETAAAIVGGGSK